MLIAAGRVPNTADIGLEEAGVELDGADTFASTNASRRLRTAFGRSGNAPAARSSRTHPSTTFGSSGTTWPEGTAARAIGWFPIACSRIPRLLASD